MKPGLQMCRWLPFSVLSFVSLCVAAGVSRGRKPFEFELTLSVHTLADAITKVLHWEATALVFGLACLAVGSRRMFLAFALTMAVCLAWELAEATAVGHTARLADLAPDLLAAFASLLVLSVARSLVRRPVSTTSEGEQM